MDECVTKCFEGLSVVAVPAEGRKLVAKEEKRLKEASDRIRIIKCLPASKAHTRYYIKAFGGGDLGLVMDGWVRSPRLRNNAAMQGTGWNTIGMPGHSNRHLRRVLSELTSCWARCCWPDQWHCC